MLEILSEWPTPQLLALFFVSCLAACIWEILADG